MYPKMMAILTAALLLAGLGTALLAESGPFDKFLTIDDVQKITGLKGVKQIQKGSDPEADLKFTRQDGVVILSATFLPTSAYAGAKSSATGFKSLIPGVGEEAFVGPASGPPLYILVFRKGAYTVMLNTELEGQKSTRLAIDQVVAIAKIIASRM